MTGIFDYNSELLFNPEGRVKQIEFIKKTAELGNTCVALCNSECGILLAHCPSRSKLAEPQQKVFEINEKTLFAFSGITNDGLSIVRHLKSISVFENVIKDRSLHHLTCFDDICYDAAIRTIMTSERMYGVTGILMTDYDGIKLSEFDPSGYVREVIGVSIGNKAQSCRTILELEYGNIKTGTQEQLLSIGLQALKNAYPDPKDDNFSYSDVYAFVLEKGKHFRQLDSDFFQ